MRPLPLEQIAGGRVTRPFNSPAIAQAKGLSGDRIPMTTELSLDELKLIPAANRNALIENNFIMVWPSGGTPIVANGVSSIPPVTGNVPPEGTKRHIVSRGFGKFDVIEGVVLSKDVSKDQATALAAAYKPPVIQASAETPAAPRVRRERKKANKDRGGAPAAK